MARALGKLCKDAAGCRRKRNVVCADNLVRKLEKRFLGIQSLTCYKEELKGAIEIGINLRPLACNSHTVLFTSLRVSSLAFSPPYETHESMVVNNTPIDYNIIPILRNDRMVQNPQASD
jgi:hypothetical protein